MKEVISTFLKSLKVNNRRTPFTILILFVSNCFIFSLNLFNLISSFIDIFSDKNKIVVYLCFGAGLIGTTFIGFTLVVYFLILKDYMEASEEYLDLKYASTLGEYSLEKMNFFRIPNKYQKEGVEEGQKELCVYHLSTKNKKKNLYFK